MLALGCHGVDVNYFFFFCNFSSLLASGNMATPDSKGQNLHTVG